MGMRNANNSHAPRCSSGFWSRFFRGFFASMCIWHSCSDKSASNSRKQSVTRLYSRVFRHIRPHASSPANQYQLLCCGFFTCTVLWNQKELDMKLLYLFRRNPTRTSKSNDRKAGNFRGCRTSAIYST